MNNPILKLGGRFTVRHVPRLQCPGCGLWTDLTVEQWHGAEPVACECGGFSETHDFAAMAQSASAFAAKDAPQEENTISRPDGVTADEPENSGQPNVG